MSRWKHKLILLENVNVIDRKSVLQRWIKKKMFGGNQSFLWDHLDPCLDVDFIVWVDLHILSYGENILQAGIFTHDIKSSANATLEEKREFLAIQFLLYHFQTCSQIICVKQRA